MQAKKKSFRVRRPPLLPYTSGGDFRKHWTWINWFDYSENVHCWLANEYTDKGRISYYYTMPNARRHLYR